MTAGRAAACARQAPSFGDHISESPRGQDYRRPQLLAQAVDRRFDRVAFDVDRQVVNPLLQIALRYPASSARRQQGQDTELALRQADHLAAGADDAAFQVQLQLAEM